MCHLMQPVINPISAAAAAAAAAAVATSAGLADRAASVVSIPGMVCSLFPKFHFCFILFYFRIIYYISM